ncbi:sigma-54 dependent transcriptional regulator [Desulfonatronovibrio hydrogenovorans]|uniref:sigma-54 dependent transcriptional regulator n=1 Tax=Desulfonatronovibrio hydrogenovorans TaxID=53245 RepID=UPI0004916B38|nr:sigma-54 dependent transcriptional regulator [Desulfonatronovibrio hydrogenovorans]
MSAKSILFIARPDLAGPVMSKLRDQGFEILMSESLSGAMKILKDRTPELIFSQAVLPGFRADQFLSGMEDQAVSGRVIVVAEHGTSEEARKILELGAKDYWLAPLVWEKIQAVLPQEPAAPHPRPPKPRPSSQAIIGNHQSIKRVLTLARQVGPSKATILISGESGTGKEMFARYLHSNSPRAGGPFVAINCAALPEHLLESELFGHEKGSFTGAISRKMGKFELADTGTILLDEISEMDMALQAKLLRVLQESEVDRVGGTETVKVDVRVLATTNRDMEECVSRGQFRQDLFYRLNVIPLKLPALRERGDDVLLLARHFVADFCSQYGLGALVFDPEAEKWLTDYDWPGNVRELQNLMERAVLLAGSRGVIKKAHFLLGDEDWLDEAESDEPHPAKEVERPGSPQGLDFDEVIPISEMEKRLIIKGLEKTGGNRTQASELLGISVRTLRNKLNEYRKDGLAL